MLRGGRGGRAVHLAHLHPGPLTLLALVTALPGRVGAPAELTGLPGEGKTRHVSLLDLGAPGPTRPGSRLPGMPPPHPAGREKCTAPDPGPHPPPGQQPDTPSGELRERTPHHRQASRVPGGAGASVRWALAGKRWGLGPGSHRLPAAPPARIAQSCRRAPRCCLHSVLGPEGSSPCKPHQTLPPQMSPFLCIPDSMGAGVSGLTWCVLSRGLLFLLLPAPGCGFLLPGLRTKPVSRNVQTGRDSQLPAVGRGRGRGQGRGCGCPRAGDRVTCRAGRFVALPPTASPTRGPIGQHGVSPHSPVPTSTQGGRSVPSTAQGQMSPGGWRPAQGHAGRGVGAGCGSRGS